MSEANHQTSRIAIEQAFYRETLLLIQHEVHCNRGNLVLLLAQPALLAERALTDVAVVTAAAGGVAHVPAARRSRDALGAGELGGLRFDVDKLYALRQLALEMRQDLLGQREGMRVRGGA